MDNFKSKLSYALTLISKKPYTENQIQEKIYTRFNDKNNKKVINYLKEINLIDDLEYTKNFIIYKSSNSGKRKIFFQCKKKGIPKKIFDEAYTTLNIKEKPVIEELIKIKSKTYKKDISYYEFKKKIIPFLVNRGFDISDILKVLGKYKDYRSDLI